jgi:serine/threonine-protein kinase RsbW
MNFTPPVFEKTSGRLTLPAQAESLRTVELLIQHLFEVHGISTDYLGNVLIAMSEASNNAILHGCPGACTPEFDLLYAYSDHTLRFAVKDCGQGFCEESVPDPTLPENLERESGRGIFLMRRLSDELVYSDRGRQVDLIFRVS